MRMGQTQMIINMEILKITLGQIKEDHQIELVKINMAKTTQNNQTVQGSSMIRFIKTMIKIMSSLNSIRAHHQTEVIRQVVQIMVNLILKVEMLLKIGLEDRQTRANRREEDLKELEFLLLVLIQVKTEKILPRMAQMIPNRDEAVIIEVVHLRLSSKIP